MSYMQLDSIIPNFKRVFHFELTHYIATYCALPLAFIILFINSFLLWIFWKKKATNTTHILVAAMSISETMYAFIPTVFVAYLYEIKKFRSFLPYEYCDAYYIIFIFWTSVFRYHSIWLTVALATQRFICVIYPFEAASLITRKRTIFIIIGIFVLSLLMQYFDIICVDRIKVNMSWTPDSAPRETCVFVRSEWSGRYIHILFPIHAICSVLLLSFIPFVWLVVVGSLLIRRLRKATNWRAKFVNKCETTNRHVIVERKLTVLTIWIIVLFLIFQTPYSVSESVLAYYIVFGGGDHIMNYLMTAKALTQSILVLTLPSTFIIYIICYKKYFEYIKTLFQCRQQSSMDFP